MFSHHNIIICLNKHKIQLRPNAELGLWLMFMLPLALIISAASQPVTSTGTYKLSSIFSFGLILSSLVFLFESSKSRSLKCVNTALLVACAVTASLFWICLHKGVLFSLLSGFTSTILYYKLYIQILEKLPKSFTLGEAAVCSQAYIMLLYFTTINICNNIIKPSTSVMQICTTTIQVGFLCLSIVIVLIYKFSIQDAYKFYTLAGVVVLLVMYLLLDVLIKRNALLWILTLVWEDLQQKKVILYWIPLVAAAVIFTNWRIKKAKKATTAVRKIFHVLIVGVFIPGLLYNCSLLYLCSGLLLIVFCVLEILRVLDLPPLGKVLQDNLVVFGDEKDAGIIAFTPIYLLVGCSLPIWVHPAPCDVTNSAVFNLLPLLSGVLSIGIGDAAASIVGSKLGKHCWKDSRKTIEGTVAYIVSQFIVIIALIYLDQMKLLSQVEFLKAALAVVITALIEAKTDQIDNLALPLVMYTIVML